MSPQFSKDPDSQFIRQMFDRLAKRYDFFNHLTGLGLAGLWRSEALRPLKPGMRVLDLGCGTGDLSLAALRKMDGMGDVTGLDFSENMLIFARQRAKRMGFNGSHSLKFILKRAEDLPIEKEPYDLVVSGFVLRNLYENIDQILTGVYSSLKIGGRISFLDITDPKNRVVRALWRFYMNTVVALYGKILFGKDYPAFYLTQSAQRFLKADELTQELKKKGFKDVQTKFFMFGAIALYQARK